MASVWCCCKDMTKEKEQIFQLMILIGCVFIEAIVIYIFFYWIPKKSWNLEGMVGTHILVCLLQRNSEILVQFIVSCGVTLELQKPVDHLLRFLIKSQRREELDCFYSPHQRAPHFCYGDNDLFHLLEKFSHIFSRTIYLST